MNKEVRNPIPEPDHSTAGDKSGDSSTPFVWGLILGVIIAVVAAVRRWIRVAGKESLPPDVEGITSRPPAGLPSPETGLQPIQPGDSKPISATFEPEDLAGQGTKAQGAGPAGTESLAPAAKQATSSLLASTGWQEPTKYVVGVCLFLALLVLLYMSRSVIPTVIVAALLAMIVHPVIGFFQRRLKLRRGLSIAIVYLLIIALLILIPLILIPSTISAINDLINIDFQGWADNAAQFVQTLADRVAGIPVLNSLLGPLFDSVTGAFRGISTVPTPEPVSYDLALESLVDRLSRTVGIIATVVGPIVSAVITVVFMLLISLHLSLSGQNMLEGFPRILPPRYASEIMALVERIGGVWVSFLRGQFALMVIIGLMVWLGNAILGNRYPLLLGVISGTLEIIPNLGPALALIPGVSLALIFGSSHFALDPLPFALIVLAFYLLVQVLENNLIVPYVLGGELDVPPLAVILGVMIGGTVAGMLGVLLATPFIASGREVFRYLYDKILEVPDQPELEDRQPSFLDSIRNRIRGVRLPFGRGSDQAPASGAGTD